MYGLGQSHNSDSTGLAVFDSLQFMDGLSGCYRIAFFVVLEPGRAVVNVSMPVCMENRDMVVVAQQPSSVSHIAGATCSVSHTMCCATRTCGRLMTPSSLHVQQTASGVSLHVPFGVSIIRPYYSDFLAVRAVIVCVNW